jgi:hypothetical protein
MCLQIHCNPDSYHPRQYYPDRRRFCAEPILIKPRSETQSNEAFTSMIVLRLNWQSVMLETYFSFLFISIEKATNYQISEI